MNTEELPHIGIVTDINLLRTKSRPTTLEEIKELDLVARIKTNLAKAWTTGYGLAAIQIGVPVQMAWYRIAFKSGKVVERILFNPEILEQSEETLFPGEGCLSMPGLRFDTKRFRKIKVKNGDGEIIEAEGIEAIVLQHEWDHMHGILASDRMIPKIKAPVPGRNDPCLCGSGKKYKKCCLK